MPALLAFLSAGCFGVADFFGGLLSRRNPALLVVLWSQMVGLVIAVLTIPLVNNGTFGATQLGTGAAAGAFSGLGLIAFYQGLATGKISVVAPVAGILTAALPMLGGLVLDGDRPSALAWVGILAAVPAIWLISAVPVAGDGNNSGFRLAVIAGVGFGIFGILVTRVPGGSEGPLLASVRGGSVLVLLLLATVRLGTIRLQRRAVWPAALIGAGDTAGILLFLLAATMGMLTIVAVLAALYPAVTVVLARFVLGDRLLQRQSYGLGMAALGVTLIAVG